MGLIPELLLILTVLFILQGIALVGGGMILVFQAMQTYVVDAFTLHAASGTYPVSIPFLTLNANGTFEISSFGSGIMFALPRWVRLPALRHPNVQQAWLREGRHHPRMRVYSAWMPRVRFFLPL